MMGVVLIGGARFVQDNAIAFFEKVKAGFASREAASDYVNAYFFSLSHSW